MSLRTGFDRHVDLELTTADGENDRGNEVRATSTVEAVPCSRGQLTATEDNLDRDQQARTFEYLFPPVFGSVDLAARVDGRARIIDGDDTLEILGAPVVATSRGRVRHVQVRAYVVG